MGIFAGELYAVLERHSAQSANPWAILTRLGVHQQQIERLQAAFDEIGVVATLQASYLTQLRQELSLTPAEWARLQAGLEADTFLRLLLYHNYPVDEAANKSNAIFSAAVKDKLATGGRSDSIFPSLKEHDQSAIVPGPIHHRPRGPRPKDRNDF
jgi:hypothetical protein